MSVTTLDIPLRATTQRWSLPLLTVFVLWVLVVFDPHLWVAPGLLGPIPKFIYLGLAVMILLQAPGRVWYFPLLILIVGAIISSGSAENIGVAQDLIVKILLLYYILAIGSLTFVTSIEKTTLLLHLFLWQFLWWSFHANIQRGLVPWHPDLGNEDGLGPLMVIGMAYCYYFGVATRKRSLRWMAFFFAGLCVLLVVSSFARGAVVAAGVVLVYSWLRSPRKGQAFVAALCGLGIFVLFANILFPGGTFWQEMSTISEGFDTGTGLDRWFLWKTAWYAFLARPIFGVGAANTGIFVGNYLFWSDPGMVEYFASPDRLYDLRIHSLYLEVLSEFGLVGASAFVALVVDFWKRNSELRSRQFIDAWRSVTEQRLDLRMLSLALEAGMVGFLAGGVFYNQLYPHWFYSLLVLNRLLYANVERVVRQRQ